ncbi:MAG: cytochrome c oxidase accessory protein CcoG [bacterium]|nr:cytochrome c oxidase accessory protein CcoG [bacterium]
MNAPEAREQVLSTLNRDGSRRWIRPKPAPGRFHRRRLIFAWSLIFIFNLMPILKLNGKPLMLLDVPKREFTFFGTTFLPTDTFLLMLLLFSIFVGIFLVTAIWGRVWCGWACPQTVYMEYLFRPLERWLEGGRQRQLQLDTEGPDLRRGLKYLFFFVLALFLANTFLAYFVGWSSLLEWMTQSPARHPMPFAVVLGTTLLVFLDFTWFREQTCIIACPYGRFQSVLLDRRSLIVGYDEHRGEPRAKQRKGRSPDAGDCIECLRCVDTCPTGIDIRAGLQMECIACTQCIDACDTVMERTGRPRGLIRYTSQQELTGEKSSFLRPRVVIYCLILVAMFSTLAFSLAGKSSADVTLLRGLGAPFSELQNGQISNQIRLKIANRSDETRSYHFSLEGSSDLQLIAPENPLVVSAGDTQLTAAFITAPRTAFRDGEIAISLHISDATEFERVLSYRLLGPHRAGSP